MAAEGLRRQGAMAATERDQRFARGGAYGPGISLLARFSSRYSLLALGASPLALSAESLGLGAGGLGLRAV